MRWLTRRSWSRSSMKDGGGHECGGGGGQQEVGQGVQWSKFRTSLENSIKIHHLVTPKMELVDNQHTIQAQLRQEHRHGVLVALDCLLGKRLNKGINKYQNMIWCKIIVYLQMTHIVITPALQLFPPLRRHVSNQLHYYRPNLRNCINGAERIFTQPPWWKRCF